MKTRNLEFKGGKFMAMAAFLMSGFASQASNGAIKELSKDFMSSGGIGFYLIGGIIVGGLILHIIVNHIIKPKEDESDHRMGNMAHHHHHRHHHQHRIVKKTS